MGGGPLMHISSLYLITYAFNFSKKQGKKNIILGSGVGPIFYKKYKKELCKIFSLSDNIILRDKSSKNYALKIHQDVGIQINKKISVSYDPSIISCYNFLKNIRDSKQTKNYDIIVNLRDFPLEYASNEKQISQAKENLSFFISYLNNLEKKVLLLPNHYFSVGGDDREYFNLLKFKYNLNNNIDVQNKPLNLEETLLAIKNSEKGIGMRFHSILFQTIVNNKNFVLDYAEPEKGKIYGFLKDINFNFNKNYINIQNETLTRKMLDNIEKNQFELNKNKLNKLYKIFR
jgi:polysaccharide pyruvyl transferase WcaK-like protein